MPSRTIHIPEDAYEYIRENSEDSFSGKAADLIEKGIETEVNQ